MEIVLAAFLSSAVSALAALMGMRFTQAGEEARTQSAERLRLLDHQHEHRGRLHSDRLSAYRRFSETFMHQIRADEKAHMDWRASDHALQRYKETGGDDRLKWLDFTTKQRSESFEAASQARLAVEDALAELELVASASVFEAADVLSNRLVKVRLLGFDATGTAPEKWLEYFDAVEEARKARQRLREAIREELLPEQVQVTPR